MKSVMKKTVAVGTLCTLLMGTAAYGTLAYFQEQETATNVFTSGNFEMDLTETHWEWHENSDENGKQIDSWNEGASDEAGAYKTEVEAGRAKWGKKAAENFVPGRTIPKNPAVAVAQGGVPAYVRMTLQVPDTVYEISNLGGKTDGALVNFDMSDAWKMINSVQDLSIHGNTTLIYEYVGEEDDVQKIDPTKGVVELNPLFENIQISTEATTEDVEKLATTEFNIVVNAYGVQADEFESVDAAFEATYPQVTK